MATESQELVNPIDIEDLVEDTPLSGEGLTQDDVAAQFKAVEQKNESNEAGTKYSDFDAYLEEQIKAVVPDYEIPKELKTMKKADGTPLTAKEAHELRVKVILDNTEVEADDDEFISNYRKAKANGVDPNSFVQQYNNQNSILSLPSKDFLHVYFKNMKTAEGNSRYSEDDINKFFDTKSAIEIDQYAANLKDKIKSSMDFKVSSDRLQQIEQLNQQNAKIVNGYVEKLKTDQNLYGIELGEAEKEDMLKSVGSMFMKDKSGVSEFDRLMSNDNFVLQVAPVLYLLKSGKLQTIITAMKEGVKSKTLDNLDPNPKSAPGSVSSPGGIDIDDLTS